MAFSCRILLNAQQIALWNQKNLLQSQTGLCSLFEQETIETEALQALLEQQKISVQPYYNQYGNLYSDQFYQALEQRANVLVQNGGNQKLVLQRAVLIENSFLRTMPTMAKVYQQEEIGDLDRFAVSLLKIGEPVVVYGQDSSGIWSFVQSRQSCGWLLTDHLAWETDDWRWQQYCCQQDQAVVIDSRKMLTYIDCFGRQTEQLLLMGTRLPLYDVSAHTFVIGIPIKDKNNKVALLQTLAQRDGGVIAGNLPLSAQNIISQGKKMLGEPYGWGGTNYNRDCSSLVADLFSVFGMLFPRNSRQQANMLGTVSCSGSGRQKRQAIARLTPGSVLYFPGHAMLYTGTETDPLKILHSVYAIGLHGQEEIVPHKIRRVVEGSLLQFRVNGQLLLDAVTAYWDPQQQKDFL